MVSGTKTALPLRQLYRALICEDVVPVVRLNITPCMIIHNPLLVTENPEKESIFCLLVFWLFQSITRNSLLSEFAAFFITIL